MNLFFRTLLFLCAVGCASQSPKTESSNPTTYPTTATSVESKSVLVDSKSGFSLPPYRELTLPNGLRVLLIESPTLPAVTMNLLVKTGVTQDPKGLEGLNYLVSQLLDKGTKSKTAPKIAESLARIGAHYSVSPGEDFTMMTVSGLSKTADEMLSLFNEILMEPTFSDSEILRLKKQMVAEIQNMVDSPRSYADYHWESYLFGEHPYGRSIIGTEASIAAIAKKHIISHYFNFFRPSNSILAVTGRLSPEFLEKIEASFSAWSTSSREIPVLAKATTEPIEGRKIRLLTKNGLQQSQVRMGHLGISRTNEDFLTLRLMNTILGGAFYSRLNTKLRKDLGLTYGVSSGFDARKEPGPFTITTFTKNASVGKLVEESLKVLGDARDQGFTSDDVERARGYMRGNFAFSIETAEKLGYNMLVLRAYGIPDTYLTQYLRQLDRISTSDVNRVLRKYVDDRNIRVLVYGPPEVKVQLDPVAPVELKVAK